MLGVRCCLCKCVCVFERLRKTKRLPEQQRAECVAFRDNGVAPLSLTQGWNDCSALYTLLNP